jgi:hypothetical protein
MAGSDPQAAWTGPDPRAGRAGRYAWLLVLGVAVGFFEAAVVVYLRELYYPTGFRFPVVMAPPRVGLVEIARELASLVLLAAAARLAGSFFLERFAAFAILFGTWDLFYYVFLWLVLGWPEGLATWDILFLIPVPWVGPVWAPCAVSVALVGCGSLVYLTPSRPWRLGAVDWAVLVAAGLLVIASMTAGWRVVPENRVPESFPAALFALGLLLGLVRFFMIARRAAPAAATP